MRAGALLPGERQHPRAFLPRPGFVFFEIPLTGLKAFSDKPLRQAWGRGERIPGGIVELGERKTGSYQGRGSHDHPGARPHGRRREDRKTPSETLEPPPESRSGTIGLAAPWAPVAEPPGAATRSLFVALLGDQPIEAVHDPESERDRAPGDRDAGGTGGGARRRRDERKRDERTHFRIDARC